MRVARGLWISAALMCAASPGVLGAQGRAATSSNSSAGPGLPKLELVGEYGCATCSNPGSLGTNPRVLAVAAGPGASFAVLLYDAPAVRVWNLDSGAVSQFGLDAGGAAKPPMGRGLALLRDSVLVALPTGAPPTVQVFTPAGAFVAQKPMEGFVGAGFYLNLYDGYTSSPAGRWIIQREGPAGVGGSGPIDVVDRQSGPREVLDVPSPLLATYRGPHPDGALNTVSVAVADDGTVAMGYGGAGYRLMLIPGGGSAPIEGGRSVPMRPASQEQIDRIRKIDAAEANWLTEAGEVQFSSGALKFDATGRLWVRTKRGDPNATVFDVFNRKLEYLGEVKVDGVVSVFHIGSQLVVGAIGDALKSSSIKVWRIQEP
jgi:hypothetical protein